MLIDWAAFAGVRGLNPLNPTARVSIESQALMTYRFECIRNRR